MSIAGIVWVFFIVLNLIIYHKIFAVYYFNFQKGFTSELIGAMVIAAFETALLMTVGPYILIIVGVIVAIFALVAFFKKRGNEENSDCETDDVNISTIDANNAAGPNTVTNKSDIIAESVNNKSKEVVEVDDAIICKTIEEYQRNGRVSAIKVFREQTGLSLYDSKNYIDKIIEENCNENVAESSKAIDEVVEKNNTEDVMFCTYCGKKIKRSSKFCNYCGKENKYKK